MLRIWRKISLKRVCPFHKNTGFTLTLLEKDPQNLNTEESSENRETFSGSKFSPATGVSGVGYFSNECGFSVESSSQRISSKFLLCKRNDSLVVW